MSQVRTYDPGRVNIIFGGHIITGPFADGTFVKVERDTPSFSKFIGADGGGCRVRSRDKSGKVTITLSAASPSNDILSAYLAADELLGTGSKPLQVKDLNGTTLAHAEAAWITKPADIERGKEMSNTEWVFEALEIKMNVGEILEI